MPNQQEADGLWGLQIAETETNTGGREDGVN